MGNLHDILTMANEERRANCKGQDCFECELNNTWCEVRRLAWKATVNKQLMETETELRYLREEYAREYKESVKELNKVLKRMREL